MLVRATLAFVVLVAPLEQFVLSCESAHKCIYTSGQEEIRKRLRAPHLGPCVHSQIHGSAIRLFPLLSPQNTLDHGQGLSCPCSLLEFFFLARSIALRVRGHAQIRTKGPITHEKVDMYQLRITICDHS
jgi:hypothetical protein